MSKIRLTSVVGATLACGVFVVAGAGAGAASAGTLSGVPTPGNLGSPAQVWVQSFERATADTPCVAPTWQTPWNDAWTLSDKTWRPSWELWANGGRGGWTCTRAITWDPGTPAVVDLIS